MKFWDSPAVLPLLLDEPGRDTLLALLADDPVILPGGVREGFPVHPR